MHELPFEREVDIVMLLASPRSRYEGRPADGLLPATGVETHPNVTIRAGLGIVGDRYFAAPAHKQASITLLAVESLEQMAAELGSAPFEPADARRNIVLRGVDVDSLRGATLELDSGFGPVRLQVNRPANPCAWMNVVLAAGAHKAMRGRGGMRCEPLTDGELALGPAMLRSSIPLG
jgi:MOSC domain-containing protein YiiM